MRTRGLAARFRKNRALLISSRRFSVSSGFMLLQLSAWAISENKSTSWLSTRLSLGSPRGNRRLTGHTVSEPGIEMSTGLCAAHRGL